MIWCPEANRKRLCSFIREQHRRVLSRLLLEGTLQALKPDLLDCVGQGDEGPQQSGQSRLNQSANAALSCTR